LLESLHQGNAAELKLLGTVQPFETEYCRKDGSRIPVLIGYAAIDEQRAHGVAFVLDLTERKRSELELDKLRSDPAYMSPKQIVRCRWHAGSEAIGKSEDIADVVAFLASDGARWITGRTGSTGICAYPCP
jgi:NAD(P)-dependent dehydrogenase (short-subunit alcohol dehydrogenase family)